MAAALLDHHAKGKVHVRSAGSDPADQLNPAVVAAMAEWDIDLAREFPKPLTDEVVQAADAVVTMGCGDACPLYPGKRYLDWELEDPEGKLPVLTRPARPGVRRGKVEGIPGRRARPATLIGYRFRCLVVDGRAARPAAWQGAQACGQPLMGTPTPSSGSGRLHPASPRVPPRAAS